MSQIIDAVGHPVTATSPSTVDRYDRAILSQLSYSDDVVEAWDAAVADEPEFALGQIGRAYLACLSSEGPDAAAARELLDSIGDGRHLNDRERRHLAAARAYASGDLHGASERLAMLSIEYPRDALALGVGHALDFFRGDALSLRDRIGRALLAWDPTHPTFGFLLGMQAFGLEECGLYPQAEAVGMRALEHEPRDVWGLHAVVHVHEMQGRIEAGLRFMDERRSSWAEGNVFVAHNSWHEALFRLDSGDVDTPIKVYDTVLHHAGSPKVALEMLDAAALLWRMHLDGIDVGGRWTSLAEAWAEKIDEPWYVFNDMHAAMALVGAGRLDEAASLVDRLRAYVAAGGAHATSNLAMTRDVGLPVCEAIVAFGQERYGEVVERLLPIRTIVQRFGGSHAQRDAVARTLLESAIRAGNTTLARALVSERLAIKESAYSRRQLSRLLASAGDLGATAA